jgi:perosamine synthetase
MIVTDDSKLAKRAKHLSTTAKLPHPWTYVHDELGFNYRLPNINAALGCAQLEALPNTLARKPRLAEAYQAAFAAAPEVSFMCELQRTKVNYWLNAILVSEAGGHALRDSLLKKPMRRTIWCARPGRCCILWPHIARRRGWVISSLQKAWSVV